MGVPQNGFCQQKLSGTSGAGNNCMAPSFAVDRQYGLQRIRCWSTHRVKHPLHGCSNTQETNAALQKRLHGDLIRGAQNRRRTTASPKRLACQAQRRKTDKVWFGKLKARDQSEV
jgi:hypothetical protein